MLPVFDGKEDGRKLGISDNIDTLTTFLLGAAMGESDVALGGVVFVTLECMKGDVVLGAEGFEVLNDVDDKLRTTVALIPAFLTGLKDF